MHSDIISVSLLTCAAVLHEENGPPSAIRISSVVQVPHGFPPKIEVLLIVKSEAGKSGEWVLRIVIVNPEGLESDYDFVEGNNRLAYASLVGSDIPGGSMFSFGLGPKSAGTYWIKVFLNDELVTRSPITILRKEEI